MDHVHAAAATGEPMARDVVDRAHQCLDVRAALGPPHVFVQALVVLGQRMQELGSLRTHTQVRVRVHERHLVEAFEVVSLVVVHGHDEQLEQHDGDVGRDPDVVGGRLADLAHVQDHREELFVEFERVVVSGGDAWASGTARPRAALLHHPWQEVRKPCDEAVQYVQHLGLHKHLDDARVVEGCDVPQSARGQVADGRLLVAQALQQGQQDIFRLILPQALDCSDGGPGLERANNGQARDLPLGGFGMGKRSRKRVGAGGDVGGGGGGRRAASSCRSPSSSALVALPV